MCVLFRIMVKKKSQLDIARELIARQEKAVSAKISRTLKNSGSRIAGSEFDVRRDKSKTKNYNAKQLAAYSEKLSGFMDRNKQFTVDVNGTPTRAGDARLFKVLETRYNKGVNKAFAEVANLPLPSRPGMKQDGTLQDRMFEMVSTRFNKSTPVNVAFKPPVKDVRSINGPKAMKILTDDLRNRMNPQYLADRLAQDRRSFLNTLREAGMDFSTRDGSDNIVDMVNKLSDKQFATVWQYTNLAGAVFLNYESMRNTYSGKGDVLSDEDVDDTYAEVRELLVWAQAL